jgi:hypothetical protein
VIERFPHPAGDMSQETEKIMLSERIAFTKIATV